MSNNNFKIVFGYFIFITLLYIIINISIILNYDRKYNFIQYIYIFILIFGISVSNINNYS